MDNKPPFDPIRGAWIILLALLGLLAFNTALVFVACSVLRSDVVCQRWTGENATSLGVEVLAAIAILIGAAKR